MIRSSQRYISSELLHFVGRGKEIDDQYSLLIEILKSGWLMHKPFRINEWGNTLINRGAKLSNNEMYSPQVICFCDIPLNDASIHIRKYSPFGLSFEKNFLIEKGCSPVFYLPKNGKIRSSLKDCVYKESRKDITDIIKRNGIDAIHNHIEKGEHFDNMLYSYGKFLTTMEQRHDHVLDFILNFDTFLSSHIFNCIKFFDPSLSDDHEDNFYFEREWRMIGHLKFSIDDVKTIIIPKDYAKKFHVDCPEYYGQRILL